MDLVNDFPVPYKSQIKDKVQPGKILEIKGGFKMTFLTPDFAVNLLSKCESAVDPNANVVLQIKAETTRTVFPPKLVTEIVANTCKNGTWGTAQRFADPFDLGPMSPKILDFAIHFTQDHFDLYANNQKFASFQYVIPIADIDHLEITGNVTLQQINWKDQSLLHLKYFKDDELDVYMPSSNSDYYQAFLARMDEKRASPKKGKIRKYLGKVRESCVPCCK